MGAAVNAVAKVVGSIFGGGGGGGGGVVQSVAAPVAPAASKPVAAPVESIPAAAAATPEFMRYKQRQAMATQDANSKGSEATTLLTGPVGVDPNALTLGKNTLLGG